MYQIHHRPAGSAEPGSPAVPEIAPYRRPRVVLRPSAVFGWLLVAFMLASGPLQYAVDGQSGSAYFSAGALGGLAVMGALLGAELRRARQLMRAGVTVDRVELGLLRARAVTAGEVTSAAGLRRVSWAGPLTLGTAAVALAVAGGLLTIASGAGFSLLAATALFTAIGVATLALLELIPAPGSPGSQLVFARAWRRSGQREAALLSAARAGVVSGWLLVAAGITLAVFVSFAGIWLAFIGGIAIAGSRLTLAGARARQRLAGLRAGDVMSTPPPVVSSFATAGDAFADVALPSRAALLIVRDPDGSFAGVVATRTLAAVPGDDRETVRVRRLVTPAAGIPTARSTDPIEQVLEAMAKNPLAGLVAVLPEPGDAADSVVVGIITPGDVARTIELMDAAHPAGRRSATRTFPFG